MSASVGGHTEIVKYLCEVGGKELVMMTDKVSACVLIHACIFVKMLIEVAYLHTYVHA
jgi:hypothetical protein